MSKDYVKPTADNAMLRMESVVMRFGGVTAVNDVSLAIPAGAITGIIGPNGAGKTTAFNIISGFYSPTEGKVYFKGKDITGVPPHKVCQRGMARTFQNIRLSQTMTALENVMVGCHVRRYCPWWMTPLGFPQFIKKKRLCARRRTPYSRLRPDAI